MNINIKLAEGATMPKRMTAGAVGYDLCSNENVLIQPESVALIKTGVYVSLPEGVEMQIRPRSGMSLKYDTSVVFGTIDSDYRGEIGVIMRNNNKEAFPIGKGDRIAQAVFAKVEMPTFEAVNELDNTKRGSGGFGSTGIIAEQSQQIEQLIKQVMKND